VTLKKLMKVLETLRAYGAPGHSMLEAHGDELQLTLMDQPAHDVGPFLKSMGFVEQEMRGVYVYRPKK
jgi:hypothetical protein